MTHRRGCGTHMGLLLHLDLGEIPCPTCLHGEQLRALELERHTPPPHDKPWIYDNGPTAAWQQHQGQRLLWDLASEPSTTPNDDHARRTA